MARPGIARRQALRGLGIPPASADVLLNQSTELASEVQSEDTPGGVSGVSNPMTEDVDADGHVFTNIGATGFAFRYEAGVLDLIAPDGGVGLPGGRLRIFSGTGDDGNDVGASIDVSPGNGSGGPGGVIFSGPITLSDLLLNGNPVTVGPIPAVIADPSGATTEDVANKVNELIAALATSGILLED